MANVAGRLRHFFRRGSHLIVELLYVFRITLQTGSD